MTARGFDKRSIGWLVPVGVALVASGVMVGRTSVRPTSTDAREVASPAKATDERRFAALEQEVRRLRVEVAAASREPPREEAPDRGEDTLTEREPAPEEVVDPAEAERAAEEARIEFLDGLADRLDTEPRERHFGAETEPAISRLLLQHLGPDVRVSDVACGSSMCRANVIHPRSPRLSEDRLADFMLQRGPLGEMSVQLDLREEGVTTLYFVRGDG